MFKEQLSIFPGVYLKHSPSGLKTIRHGGKNKIKKKDNIFSKTYVLKKTRLYKFKTHPPPWNKRQWENLISIISAKQIEDTHQTRDYIHPNGKTPALPSQPNAHLQRSQLPLPQNKYTR